MLKSFFDAEKILSFTGARPIGPAMPVGFVGISIDSRTIEPSELFVAIHGDRFDGHDFLQDAFAKGALGAVVDRVPVKHSDPPVPGIIFQVQDTLKALGEIARYHRRRFDFPVISITGSSGKTTTKALIADILSKKKDMLATAGTQNNLIGVPLTVLKFRSNHAAAVVEMGTNKIGEIRRLTEISEPTIGVITNIGPAHLETFRDLNGVLREKSSLWEIMNSRNPVVLNADDPILKEAGQKLGSRVIWFGTSQPAQVWADRITLEPWGSHCLVNGKYEMSLPLPGTHNLMNALAALACAHRVGESLEVAVESLKDVPPLPGRLTRIEWEKALVLDDSYNANPASLRAALDVLKEAECAGRRIALIGDMLELGERSPEFHAQAGTWAAESKLDFLITVGSLTRHLLEAARQAGFSTEKSWGCTTVEEAGELLNSLIQPGDVVLLKGSRKIQMERVLTCSTSSSPP